MELLDIEALLIRAHHARRLIDRGELRGIEGLALVVVPPADVLAASRQAASAKGASKEALDWFGRRTGSPTPKKAGTKTGVPSEARERSKSAPVLPVTAGLPTPPEAKKIVTIDELTAKLS